MKVFFLSSFQLLLCYWSVAQVFPVSDPETYSLLNYYHLQIESENGSNIVFTEILEERGEYFGMVCIADRDGQNKRCVDKLISVNRHRGAHPIWVGNKKVAFSDTESGDLFVAEIKGGKLVVIDSLESIGVISHYSSVSQALLTRSIDKKSIYKVDVNTLSQETLINDQIISEKLGITGIFLKHPYWSPDGDKILFAGTTDSNKYLMVSDSAASDISIVFENKPIHQQWWNNNLIFAHERGSLLMKVYNLRGREVTTIAGYGNHGTVSPDKSWIATESWYDDDPVILRLYSFGKTSESAEIFIQEASLSRNRNFWSWAHMHPTFSRDGNRVYFNAWPNGHSRPGIFAYDLTTANDRSSSLIESYFTLTNHTVLINSKLFDGESETLNFEIYDLQGRLEFTGSYLLHNPNDRIIEVYELPIELNSGYHLMRVATDHGRSFQVKSILR